MSRCKRWRGESDTDGRAPLLVALLLSISLSAVLCQPVRAEPGFSGLWVLVDTRELTLSLMQDEQALLVYDNIAIGSRGATWNKRMGDEKTPLGDFRISEIRDSERFHLFLALDYPTMEHTGRALADGRLGDAEFRRLEKAWAAGGPPPQNTPLGGHIGIHGIGAGNLEIHQGINWTDGCIALTNEQVVELAGRVSRGTRVRVR